MVSDVYMVRLVFLFTEGLTEPLKGIMKSHKPVALKDAINLTRDLQNVLPKKNIPIIPIFLPNSNKGGNHGKMNLLLRIIRKVQANKNSKEINCASHVSNLGFRDIIVLKGRHTTLKYSINIRKRERRKKHNLSPKKRV